MAGFQFIKEGEGHEPMISVALVNPEIPPNTGNVGRLCLAVGAKLHLVKPLGFELDERSLKRAGLDYWPRVDLKVWESFQDFVENTDPSSFVLTSSKRGAPYYQIPFHPDDCILFGPETSGLDKDIFERHGNRIARIPVLHNTVRSLNLATAVGVVVYEALKRTGQMPMSQAPDQ